MRIRKQHRPVGVAPTHHRPSPPSSPSFLAPAHARKPHVDINLPSSALCGSKSHRTSCAPDSRHLNVDSKVEPEVLTIGGLPEGIKTLVKHLQGANSCSRKAVPDLSLETECVGHSNNSSLETAAAGASCMHVGDSSLEEAGPNVFVADSTPVMNVSSKLLSLETFLSSERPRGLDSLRPVRRLGKYIHTENLEQLQEGNVEASQESCCSIKARSREMVATGRSAQFGASNGRQEAEPIEKKRISGRRTASTSSSVSDLKGNQCLTMTEKEKRLVARNYSSIFKTDGDLPRSAQVCRPLPQQINCERTFVSRETRHSGEDDYLGHASGCRQHIYNSARDFSEAAANTSGTKCLESDGEDDERKAKRAKKLIEVVTKKTVDEKKKQQEVLPQCNRKDGRGWQCSKRVKKGSAYCEYHVVKIRANHARSLQKLAKTRSKKQAEGRGGAAAKEAAKEEADGGGEVGTWRRRRWRRKKRRPCFRSLDEIAAKAAPTAVAQPSAAVLAGEEGGGSEYNGREMEVARSDAGLTCHVGDEALGFCHGTGVLLPATSAQWASTCLYGDDHPTTGTLCVLNTDPRDWRLDLF